MDFAAARQNMVDSQLRTNKVTDAKVIDAMGMLPRERFVPGQACQFAYVDEDVKITENRFLMEPMVAARMLQAAQIKPTDSVMVIGAGYLAAAAGKLAGAVFAVEEDKDYAANCAAVLSDLEMDNVVIMEDALKNGCAKQGPYNVILFDGSVEYIPDEITAQLADNGRIVVVVAEKGDYMVGDTRIYVKSGDAVSNRSLFDANVKPLPGFAVEKGFVF